jgi:ABC-2 type transport system ATP-binding protein
MTDPERSDSDSREAIIETRGLTKRFGRVVAVNDLSLTVPRGGVFGLLGPNGSGKTTTMAILLGLVRPTAGSVRLFGQEFGLGRSTSPLKRVGAIVETPAFYPYLSGKANLRYFQAISGRGSRADLDRLLDLVELSGRADSRYDTYSLGMKQRLGIAYALLGDPELLFLDEPTNGLDPAGMAEVRELIRRLGAGGRTIVLSSHLLAEVEHVCERVAILARGRLLTSGRVEDLLKSRGAVRLRTTDDPRARTLLAARDWVAGVREEDGYLVVETEPERSAAITKALADEDVFVTEMAPQQVSLERFFLEVTEEGLPKEEQEALA